VFDKDTILRQPDPATIAKHLGQEPTTVLQVEVLLSLLNVLPFMTLTLFIMTENLSRAESESPKTLLVRRALFIWEFSFPLLLSFTYCAFIYLFIYLFI